MAAADDKVGHVRAYLEYFRDMGVHEFYRNETLEPVELPAVLAEVRAVAAPVEEKSVPQGLKPDATRSGFGTAEAVPLSLSLIHI